MKISIVQHTFRFQSRRFLARPFVFTAAAVALATGLSVAAPVAPVASAQQWSWNTNRTASNQLTNTYTFTYGGVTSSYRLSATGVDFSKPVRLVVRLHGDGGYEYNNPTRDLAAMQRSATNNNAIFLAPKAPSGGARNPSWWGNLDSNNMWLAGLMRERILPMYGLSGSDVTWFGYSGGAEILTRTFIPRNPDLVRDEAILVGGGTRPFGTDARRASRAAHQVGTLTFLTGRADNGTRYNQRFNALRAAQGGESFYRSAGYNTRSYYPSGVDHFGWNQADVLDYYLKR